MSILDELPHRCRIGRRTRTKVAGGVGVAVDTIETISEDVECWEQQASSSENALYQKKGISNTKKIFFKADPGVKEDYVIFITNRYDAEIAAADQIELDVISSPDPDASAGQGVVWRVMVSYETDTT